MVVECSVDLPGFEEFYLTIVVNFPPERGNFNNIGNLKP